ncbi:N-acetylmuramate alpha-1-phosphate uridylyltransferase MurU [Pseudohongiella spirulinae]|uniref:Mannose-1-phosphate guanylyltransferase n=1 Tax=Pseudohongiella spirulinae TaxID=1249552 RepID=A0A0S2KHE2_9GAMM|nr:nucleotidyltransferase family protein [Pseudohongiella spirulinae]ALO47362.1 mannose-1-phosphate guanylyltransferase [Pseudohongiella spirulinae]
MKAMILAAGLGQRMLPLTEHTPKPLLQVGGQSLIEWQIRRLAAAGIDDIVINLHHHGSQIEQALGSGERYGVRLAFSHEAERLETAGGIIKALPLLGEAPFVLTNADVWTDYDYSRLAEIAAQLSSVRLAHLVLVADAPHNPRGDFALDSQGLLHADGERKLTYAGVSLLHPALFTGMTEGFRPLAPLLRQAMDRLQVTGEHFAGQWHDIGTPERLRALDERLSAG